MKKAAWMLGVAGMLVGMGTLRRQTARRYTT